MPNAERVHLEFLCSDGAVFKSTVPPPTIKDFFLKHLQCTAEKTDISLSTMQERI